jgi:tRNA threonylcarbamoyladenosine biosynthesis protein TsaB
MSVPAREPGSEPIGPVLAIETSTPLGGVAVLGAGGLLAARALEVKGAHSPRLMQAVEAVLDDAGVALKALAGIGVSVGPGSFTGLRVGVATAQGLGRGAGLPLFPVPTLEAVAWGLPAGLCPPGAALAVAMAARKGELYGAVYLPRGGAMTAGVLEPLLGPVCADYAAFAADLAALEGPVVLAGTAAPGLADAIGAAVAVAPPLFARPRAAVVAWRARRMCAAGEAFGPEAVVPCYLALSQAERRAGMDADWRAKEA